MPRMDCCLRFAFELLRHRMHRPHLLVFNWYSMPRSWNGSAASGKVSDLTSLAAPATIQNVKCSATWMMRDWLPDCRPVTLPKSWLPNVVFGLAQFGWLRTLRASARNCRFVLSREGKSFR